MYFTAPATLLKNETTERKGVPYVKVIASDESLDKDLDNILSEAFTKDVKEFFKSEGIFDWDHVTIRGDSDVERGTAMVGTPTDFYQESVHGAPVQIIEGYLHKGNPYVDNTIYPALLAKSDRIKCSIGGRRLGYDENKHGGKSIYRLSMNHLAFCPSFKAINTNTSVDLVKSIGHQNEEILNFTSSSALLKSLEAGNNTDSATISGAQSLQPQSLEGVKSDITHDIGNMILYDLMDGTIELNKEAIENRLELLGCPDDKKKVLSDMFMGQLAEPIKKMRQKTKIS